VPVRIRNGTDEYEVLLVKSRWVEGVWLYPKGGVEEHEEAKMSAIRETREEAGVIGRLGPKLGSYKSSTGKEVHKMWILFVEEEYDETDKRWKEVNLVPTLYSILLSERGEVELTASVPLRCFLA